MPNRSVLVIACLVLVSSVAARGEEPRALHGKVLLGYVSVLSAPDTKCVGGTPASPPQPPYYLPCSTETTRVIDRSEVQEWAPVSPSRSVARLLAGGITFVVNCDLNGQYRGPCWGTFEWSVPGVGRWAGFWSAPIMDLLTYESKLSMAGIGSGGEIDGRRLELEGTAAPGDWYIASTVRIK